MKWHLKWILILSLFLTFKSYASIAPAIEYTSGNYRHAFIEDSDFKVKLRTKTLYEIKCNKDIVGVDVGDKLNLKFVEPDMDDELLIEQYSRGTNSAFLKTKFETYTYMRIHKIDDDVVNLMVSVNKAYPFVKTINIGTCDIKVRE